MRVTSFVLGKFVTTQRVEKGDKTLKKTGNSAKAGYGGRLMKGEVGAYFMGNQRLTKFDAGCAALSHFELC